MKHLVKATRNYSDETIDAEPNQPLPKLKRNVRLRHVSVCSSANLPQTFNLIGREIDEHVQLVHHIDNI